MKFIGAHVSAQGGAENAPLNAHAIGATAFALFTKNQRQWVAPELTDISVKAFRENMISCGYTPNQVLPHGSYLLNLCNPETEKREKSLNSLIGELRRCSRLGLDRLNIHPGSHLKAFSEEEALEIIAKEINKALNATKGITVVLENTAGQGSNLGYKFQHIGSIIKMVDDKERIGFCLDTCHAFSAGYDLRDSDAYKRTMDELEEAIGFNYLRGVHLNDSKSELGSRKDRHHSIGEGFIGVDAFRFLMNDSRFDAIPMVLETVDETIWDREISLLNSFIK